MIEKYKPTREEINKFLKRIEQRIASNNEKSLKPQQHEQRI